MNLREYLRGDFSKYIRNRLIGGRCEICGDDKQLHLHHINKFHNLLVETLQELNLNEMDTDLYNPTELNNLKYIMLGKQIACDYKTLCSKCHSKLHFNEVKQEEYLENYYNPFGNYFYVDLNHSFFKDDNIRDGSKLTFLYLCTFMNYQNYLLIGKAKGEGKFASKKDILCLFPNLSKSYYYRFMREVDEHNVFIYKQDKITINPKIAGKGTVKLSQKSRIFEEPLRELFLSSNSKAHGFIFNIYKLSANLNFANEIEISGQNTLKSRDLLKVLNYRKNITKEMLELKYNDKCLLSVKNNIWSINRCICYNGVFSKYML